MSSFSRGRRAHGICAIPAPEVERRLLGGAASSAHQHGGCRHLDGLPRRLARGRRGVGEDRTNRGRGLGGATRRTRSGRASSPQPRDADPRRREGGAVRAARGAGASSLELAARPAATDSSARRTSVGTAPRIIRRPTPRSRGPRPGVAAPRGRPRACRPTRGCPPAGTATRPRRSPSGAGGYVFKQRRRSRAGPLMKTSPGATRYDGK